MESKISNQKIEKIVGSGASKIKDKNCENQRASIQHYKKLKTFAGGNKSERKPAKT